MGRRLSDQAILASSTSSSSSTAHNRDFIKFDTIVPPKRYVWLHGEDWQIDRLGLWSEQLAQLETGSRRQSKQAGLVDGDGWAFVDGDGHLMGFGQLGQGARGKAAMRRRRWYRRIVSIPPAY